MPRRCRVLGASRMGYCRWRGRAPSAHARANAILNADIRQVQAGSRSSDGRLRIVQILRRQSTSVSSVLVGPAPVLHSQRKTLTTARYVGNWCFSGQGVAVRDTPVPARAGNSALEALAGNVEERRKALASPCVPPAIGLLTLPVLATTPVHPGMALATPGISAASLPTIQKL